MEVKTQRNAVENMVLSGEQVPYLPGGLKKKQLGKKVALGKSLGRKP